MKNYFPVNQIAVFRRRLKDSIELISEEKEISETDAMPILAKYLGFKSDRQIYRWLKEEALPNNMETLIIKMDALLKEGGVKKIWSEPGGPTQSSTGFPIVGEVSAQEFKTAIHEADEWIDLSKTFQGKGEVFVWRVRGDCMKEAGINASDMVWVRIQKTAEDGDIVLARCGDEATLKYFRKSKEGTYFEPADLTKKIPARECEVVGKVIGSLRKYL